MHKKAQTSSVAVYASRSSFCHLQKGKRKSISYIMALC